MLRSVLRTSRCLVRRQINSLALAIPQYSSAKTIKYSYISPLIRRLSASSDNPQAEYVDPVVFEEVCNETLESLCDYFEELLDQNPTIKGADVTYSVSKVDAFCITVFFEFLCYTRYVNFNSFVNILSSYLTGTSEMKNL